MLWNELARNLTQVYNLKRVVICCLHIGHEDNVAPHSLQVYIKKEKRENKNQFHFYMEAKH